MSTTEIWNRQFYCRVDNTLSDFTVNIEQLNEFADCNFASLDIGSGTLKNVIIFMNMSFTVPGKCAIGINISLFVNAKPMHGVKFFGSLSITDIQAIYANIGVAQRG